jgi:hypothetical protein
MGEETTVLKLHYDEDKRSVAGLRWVGRARSLGRRGVQGRGVTQLGGVRGSGRRGPTGVAQGHERAPGVGAWRGWGSVLRAGESRGKGREGAGG